MNLAVIQKQRLVATCNFLSDPLFSETPTTDDSFTPSLRTFQRPKTYSCRIPLSRPLQEIPPLHSLQWPTRQARTLRRLCARLSRPTTKQFELRLPAVLSKVCGQYDFAASGTEGNYVALIYEFGCSRKYSFVDWTMPQGGLWVAFGCCDAATIMTSLPDAAGFKLVG